MAKFYKIAEHTLTNIADAMRMWTQKTDKVTPDEMPQEVDAVFNAGADIGYTTGHSHGKEAGIEEGRQAEYEYYWDMIQANGEKDDWQFGFYKWNIVGALRPKYKIMPSGSIAQMFINNGNLTTVFNWGFPESGVTSCNGAFAQCYNFLGFVDENGDLITDKPFFGSGVTDYRFCFQNNEKIEYICIDVSNVSNLYTGTFGRCLALIRLKIFGEIKTGGLNLSASKKLDKASHVNVVDCISTTASITVTFSKVAVDKAFETAPGANDGSASQEWADLVDTRPNATIVLA